jgi:hypothetical protein
MDSLGLGKDDVVSRLPYPNRVTSELQPAVSSMAKINDVREIGLSTPIAPVRMELDIDTPSYTFHH